MPNEKSDPNKETNFDIRSWQHLQIESSISAYTNVTFCLMAINWTQPADEVKFISSMSLNNTGVASATAS